MYLSENFYLNNSQQKKGFQKYCNPRGIGQNYKKMFRFLTFRSISRSSENQKLANQHLNSTDLKLYKKNPPKVSGTLPRINGTLPRISGTPSNSLDIKEDGNLAFLARRHKQRKAEQNEKCTIL